MAVIVKAVFGWNKNCEHVKNNCTVRVLFDIKFSIKTSDDYRWSKLIGSKISLHNFTTNLQLKSYHKCDIINNTRHRHDIQQQITLIYSVGRQRFYFKIISPGRYRRGDLRPSIKLPPGGRLWDVGQIFGKHNTILSNIITLYAVINCDFKRQRNAHERERERAVSYTHLDVYKRQALVVF